MGAVGYVPGGCSVISILLALKVCTQSEKRFIAA